MRTSPLELAVLSVLAKAEKPLSEREVRDRLGEVGVEVSLMKTEGTIADLRARLLVEWGPKHRYPVVVITRAGRTVVEREP